MILLLGAASFALIGSTSAFAVQARRAQARARAEATMRAHVDLASSAAVAACGIGTSPRAHRLVEVDV